MTREKIKENFIKGKAIKEQLKEHPRITLGVVFKCYTTRLGQTVFNACKDNQLKKKEDERARIRKQKDDYVKIVKNQMRFMLRSRILY